MVLVIDMIDVEKLEENLKKIVEKMQKEIDDAVMRFREDMRKLKL